MNGTDIVSEVLRLLAQKLGNDRFELWFGSNTRLSVNEVPTNVTANDGAATGSTLLVEAHNKFSENWLRAHYRGALETVASEAMGTVATVEFRINESLAPRSARSRRNANGQSNGKRHHASVAGTTKANGTASGMLQTSLLFSAISDATTNASAVAYANPERTDSASLQFNAASESGSCLPRRRFATLESFVVGPTNRLAHASAHSVIERPGAWTPLFVHGPHGCGKTHLLEGIWTAARTSRTPLNAVYLSAEQFTTLFLTALRGAGLPSFRRKYRGVELLLIDDLQFLAKKKATLSELLHTIDALLRDGRQLVFSADRPPHELADLGPELTTRLSGGMVCRVESPELEMRIGLVRRFAGRMSFQLPDEVVELVATQIPAGARELQGAVNRLHAASRMLNCGIDRALAEETLAELMHSNGRAVRLADIEQAVCDVFGLDKHSLQTDRRAKRVSTPRMLAMWLARKYTRAGLSEIGHYFGRRSHSTVISAHKRVETMVAAHSEIELSHATCKIEDAVRRIEAQLKTG